MNNKNKGFLLFEFLLTSLLAATLMIIIYQSYKTVNKSLQYIQNNANLETQKMLLLYQLELDAMHITIPNSIYDLYPKIKKILNTNKDKNEAQNKKNIETNDEKNKKVEKEFKTLSIFFPELIKTTDQIKISWISTRKILNKNSFIKINYIFKLTDKTYKENQLYRLYRREDILEADYTIKKHGNEYIFLTYILDPEVYFIMPKIILELKEKDNEKAKNKNIFFHWTEKPSFISEQETTKLALKDFNKKSIIPFNLLINGTIITNNLEKELDIQFSVSFPIADYALQMLYNNDNNENNEKFNLTNNNKKDEKPLNSQNNQTINTSIKISTNNESSNFNII